MEGLRTIVISGGKWMLFRQFLSQSIRIIVGVLLTRIIAPGDFGLVAKTVAITGIVELILHSSISGSIVQSEDINDKQLNSLFVITLIFSSLLAVIVFLSADIIAAFYDDNQVNWIVQVSAVSIFLSGLGLVFNALLLRKFLYKQMALINILATVLSSALALIMAYYDYGYKALIMQILVFNTIIAFGSVILSGWLPRIDFSFRAIKDHLHFGKDVLYSNFLNYAVRNTDNIAIGRLQSDIELGFYSRAYYLFFMPLNQLSQVINSTLFPVFSRIQSDRKRINSILDQLQELIILFIFPLVFLFYINIEFFVFNIFGEEWVQSISYFKIFTPLLLIQLFTLQISNVYLSLNKMKEFLRISIIAKPLIIISIIVAASESAEWVAIILVVLSSVTSLYTYYIGMGFLQKESFYNQYVFLKKTLFRTLAFFVFLIILDKVIHNSTYLLISTLVTLILYYGGNIYFRKELKKKLFDLLKT